MTSSISDWAVIFYTRKCLPTGYRKTTSRTFSVGSGAYFSGSGIIDAADFDISMAPYEDQILNTIRQRDWGPSILRIIPNIPSDSRWMSYR